MSTPKRYCALAVLACALMTGACREGEAEAGAGPVPPAPIAEVATLPAQASIDAGAPIDAEPLADALQLGPRMGEFELTYYWMASQPKDAGKREVQIYTMACEPLAKVSRSFARKLAMEGTGRLRDGRTLNVATHCDCEHSPCFFATEEHQRWGVGVAYRPLAPFRSVAVDIGHVSIGQMLYIPELDGLTVPGRPPYGGFVHDGCVIADDRGGNVRGEQLDFFTGQRSYYSGFFRRHRITKVTVYEGTGRCEQRGRELVAINRNST